MKDVLLLKYRAICHQVVREQRRVALFSMASLRVIARVVFETAGPSPACSKCRHHLDGGFMERVVGRTYLNAYLPVTTHHQVAGAAEMAFPIRL